MANVKISELPVAGPLDVNADALPIVNEGSTRQTTPAAIVAAVVDVTPLAVSQGGTGLAYMGNGYMHVTDNAVSTQASIPNADVTGLGTMSTQDANAVAITGGSITGITVPEATHAATADSATIADAIVGQGTAATLNAGVALGVATLDGAGTVPMGQIPAALVGAVQYQGGWDASTNNPTLTSSVGTKGQYYVVTVAGSTNLNGITAWKEGDWAIFNGTVWQAVYNTNGVFEVNGKTGNVSLVNTDIPGFGTMSTQDADAVAITGGSISGVSLAGADVTGTVAEAAHATSADSATTATSATNADHATTADSATTATTATSATNADHATTADSATTATTADTANALNPDNDYSVNGMSVTGGILQIGPNLGGGGQAQAFAMAQNGNIQISENGTMAINGGGFNDIVTSATVGDYAPALDGTGATGTWAVDISGNAATATTATSATTATNADHATTADTATSATTAGVLYYREYWVDPTNGSDSNQGRSPASPFQTVGHALSVISNGSGVINMALGAYAETLTITAQNVDFVGMSTRSGVVHVTGDWTFANTASSLRARDISFYGDLTLSGAGSTYFDNCQAHTSSVVSKTGAGYTEFQDCDLSPTTAMAFSAGTTNFLTSKATVVEVSGTGVVAFESCPSVIAPSASAGTILTNGSIVYAATAGGNAISSTGTGVVAMVNTLCYDTDGTTPAKVSFAGAAYATINASYAKVLSTLSAACIGGVSNSDYISTRAGTVASLPSAAAVGAGARGFVTDANATTFASAVVGGGANKVPVYSDGTGWKIG